MPLTLAVISTSRIVDEFLANAAAMPEISVQALCCRPQSLPKAEAWAAQYGIPAVYTDEDACYAAGGFDAVYIGTANHLHYAAAKRALNAGYHVILEKPFVSTAAEARELFALADAKGLVLFEAITIPYMPQFAFLQQQTAKLGPISAASAVFCSHIRLYDDYCRGIVHPVFDPACQGGALGDMNVYCLHLLVGLLGMPKAAEYRPVRGENGIDVAGLALLDYGRFTATALAAKDSNSRNGMVLQGSGGYLVVDGNPNSLPAVYSLLGAQRDDCVRTDGPAAPRHRMAYEFAEFARIIAAHDTAAETAARLRTMHVMELLELLRQNTADGE